MFRTRFAPSPTGQLHLGGARTAIFAYLAAKSRAGEFVLRIEDTDQKRTVSGAVETIIKDLAWLGLCWDFGPDKPSPEFGSCYQSQRLDKYRAISQKLVDLGFAYYDQNSPEELAQLRQVAQKERRPFLFNRSLAKYDPKAKKPTVVRLEVSKGIEIPWRDKIKGSQSWASQDIGDFVILKADGFPTYHLANVVDDHLMGISLVIRGDEWLSSTPKHIYLFNKLNWPAPDYGHVPAVLAETGGQKLSKRDNLAVNISDYRQMGYQPTALVNFLALLGWNPGTEQEFFADLKELQGVFDLKQVQRSPGRFDQKRLDWLAGRHLRLLKSERLQETASQWWPKTAKNFPDDYKNEVLDLVFERLKKWSELISVTEFFFQEPKVGNDFIAQELNLEKELVGKIFTQTADLLKEGIDRGLEEKIKSLAEEFQIKTGQVFMAIRLKITGQSRTPNLIDLIKTLGQKTCLKRLNF